MTSRPSPVQAYRVRDAQQAIVDQILICLGLWFVPWISGVGCSVAEAKLIQHVLTILGCECSPKDRDNLFWFVRGKTLFLNGSTYMPVAGPVLQALEVYLFGQFAIHCALNIQGSLNESELEAQWVNVEEHILSGGRLVTAIEEYSANPLPREVRESLEAAVEWFSSAYRLAMGVPGVRWIQRIGARGMRHALHFATRQIVSLERRIRVSGAIDLSRH